MEKPDNFRSLLRLARQSIRLVLFATLVIANANHAIAENQMSSEQTTKLQLDQCLKSCENKKGQAEIKACWANCSMDFAFATAKDLQYDHTHTSTSTPKQIQENSN